MRLHGRAGRCSAAAAILGSALLGGAVGHAAETNPFYQGSYQSSQPQGYQAAPASSPVGKGIVYSFTISVSGTGSPPPLDGAIRLRRITRVGGTEVSSGDPAFSEEAILGGSVSGDPPQELTRLRAGAPSAQWPPQGYAISFVPVACGYYVIWTGRSNSFRDPSANLNAGVARVVGCTSATPPPAPPPPGTPQAVAGTAAFPPGPAVFQDTVNLATPAAGVKAHVELLALILLLLGAGAGIVLGRRFSR